MSTQLINYIMSNAIVDIYQSAYLPRRSTETALILIIDDILISLDNKAPFYLVLLDLSNAFDTLDHNIIYINLMKFVYTAKSTVDLCLLFHLEHLRNMFHIVYYLYSSYYINFSQIS